MKKRKTEAQYMQSYGVLFQNVVNDTEIPMALAEYGYDNSAILEGDQLYREFIRKYDINKTETAEQTTAYQNFSDAFEEMQDIYSVDRKKAKIVFKNQPDVLKNLQLNTPTSKRNAVIIENMRLFYDTLHNNYEYGNAMKRLNIADGYFSQQLSKVHNVKHLFGMYEQEKGESQQATKDKDKAFDAISKWVSEFYSVAKIALDDKPQLLESISKWVRS